VGSEHSVAVFAVFVVLSSDSGARIASNAADPGALAVLLLGLVGSGQPVYVAVFAVFVDFSADSGARIVPDAADEMYCDRRIFRTVHLGEDAFYYDEACLYL
jgi:hypothetical protein